MRPARSKIALLACALAATLAAAGCSTGRPNGAAREGLSVEVAGLNYNVYITRQLNLRDAEDRDYYHGPEAPPGFALYGVFIKVCNPEKGFRTPVATEFTVEDNQGNAFRPIELPPENVFAYRPRLLSHNACIPENGSAAASGPTEGSLLLFRFPNSTLENRPLELLIENSPGPGQPIQKKVVDLDI
ncbi:MAG TPA: hypothetical protein VF545_13125 [Thermoleophilaceae bacterium]|jgi:hypothetical protein